MTMQEHRIAHDALFNEGYAARRSGKMLSQNPVIGELEKVWQDGWLKANDDMLEEVIRPMAAKKRAPFVVN